MSEETVGFVPALQIPGPTWTLEGCAGGGGMCGHVAKAHVLSLAQRASPQDQASVAEQMATC